MKKKVVLICIIIASLFLIAVYFPHSLSSKLKADSEDAVSVTYTVSGIKDINSESPIEMMSDNVSFAWDTDACLALLEILDDYSYHETLTSLGGEPTLTGAGEVKDGYITISISDNILITNYIGVNAVIDENRCKIGYFGNDNSSELCERIIELCKEQA